METATLLKQPSAVKSLASDKVVVDGPERVANMLLAAVALYVVGCWVINSAPWWVLPGGIMLLALAFVQLYRVPNTLHPTPAQMGSLSPCLAAHTHGHRLVLPALRSLTAAP